MKMLRRVSIGRLITATDMTARSADAQVQPWIAQLQAFFTPEGMGNDVVNSCQVSATLCHVIPQFLSTVFCLISIPASLPNVRPIFSDISRCGVLRRHPGKPFNATFVSERAR
jgi:hypothetical protein